MRYPSLLTFSVLLLSLLLMSTSRPVFEAASAPKQDKVDSALIVANGIHKVKSVHTLIEFERQRWDWDGPDNNPKEKTVVTTWTTYDKQGRIIAIDETTSEYNGAYIEVRTERFVYSGTVITERTLRLMAIDKEDTLPDSTVELIEIVRWTPELTWKYSEQQDAGSWRIQVDSTVMNGNHQPRITYSYNSMGDSFVEEFVYDAKARLKYRRLAMKQFWSPPWEVESTTYIYNDDGSYEVRDSVFRSDPDMAEAAKRAGDRSAPGYAWKVLVMAPSTGTFHRLEWWDYETYDSKGNKIKWQRWSDYSNTWYDYTWRYNSQGKIIEEAEWRAYRGDMSEEPESTGNKDSVWYTYNNGILAMKTSWHSTGGEPAEKSVTAFGNRNPNRTDITAYKGLKGYDFVHTRYEEDELMETMYYGKDGLIRKWEGPPDAYTVSDEIEYTYYKQ